jgi:hypothetical protein
MAIARVTNAAADEITRRSDGGYVGTAAALVESWLILPEWIPALPKRKSWSYNFDGWWCAPDPYYDEDCDVIGDESAWDRVNHRVRHWDIERVKGGLFAFRIHSLRFCLYLGGPVDEHAPARAVAWHRKMVRARLDKPFCAFLQRALTPTA